MRQTSPTYKKAGHARCKPGVFGHHRLIRKHQCIPPIFLILAALFSRKGAPTPLIALSAFQQQHTFLPDSQKLISTAGIARKELLILASLATVIVVTHDPRILPFADRIAEMEDGRIQSVRENSLKNIHNHNV